MADERKSILTIDDNEDIRVLLTFVLEKEGYSVTSAKDGVTGLSLIKETRPDAVLLDVMMPEFSGFDVLDAMRNDKDPRVRQIPVLMITAKSAIEDIDQAIDLGASSYIVKPFRPVHLIAKVHALFHPEETSS